MSKKGLIKSASVISGATLLSRILGFLRDILMAGVFGTGWFAQAFFVAFRIPNMFRELVAEGASNTAFVPVFSQYLSTKKRQEFWNLVNTALVAFTIIIILIVLICVVFSPFLVRLIAPGFIHDAEKFNLAVAINRPLFAYLIFVSIAAFIMGVLYSFKSFFAPSFSPCIFNIVFIASILLADNSIKGIWIVSIGVVIAGIMQVVIQLPAMFRNGFRVRPFEFQKNIFGHPGVKLIGRLFVPRIMGAAIYQLNVLIDTVFASLSFFVGSGAIAAVYYANRLIQFPLGIFGHSISNAAFPLLSELAAKKEMDKFAETVEFSLTNILFIMIPAGLGLIVMSHPIIKFIFQRGEFDAYSTMITSTALAFYAIGLASYGANKFFALCFNSLHDTITPVKVSSLSLIINILLNTLFVVVLKAKIAGLAFASSLSAIIASIILYNLLHKRVNQINYHHIINQVVKMLLSSLFMALVIFIVWQRIEHSILGLFIIICLAVGIYILTSFFLKIYQAIHILKWMLKNKI